MQRESWNSKFGFTMAAVGSAVGLANIWRFPYVLGTNGGAAFLLLYLICLCLIGLPAFITEVFMGSHAKSGPKASFKLFGKTKLWENEATRFRIIFKPDFYIKKCLVGVSLG